MSESRWKVVHRTPHRSRAPTSQTAILILHMLYISHHHINHEGGETGIKLEQLVEVGGTQVQVQTTKTERPYGMSQSSTQQQLRSQVQRSQLGQKQKQKEDNDLFDEDYEEGSLELATPSNPTLTLPALHEHNFMSTPTYMPMPTQPKDGDAHVL